MLEAAADDEGPRLLVLLNAEHLLRQFTLDDLTEERTVFGQVDSFVPEGSQFLLQKFFLSGFGRSIRRAISVDDMLQGSEVLLGRPMTGSS